MTEQHVNSLQDLGIRALLLYQRGEKRAVQFLPVDITHPLLLLPSPFHPIHLAWGQKGQCHRLCPPG